MSARDQSHAIPYCDICGGVWERQDNVRHQAHDGRLAWGFMPKETRSEPTSKVIRELREAESRR